MTEVLIKPGRLFLRLLMALLYLALTLAILRGIAPAMISTDSTPMVILGLSLIALWLISSICLAIHLFKKRRSSAATTKEEDL
ncbi:hypothetical protein [Pseudomonas sp. Fl4BN1]|uniref:hypothetical protein n=1 Tax=Pseudomonas sp. Fl4BN1 TaxID=2697651 RepID=UPI001378FBEB|nr:hypothetical protein [Pseudomonas sp. Fl4BN1]NBF13056.1 hypothetical protein [Pseudomonas sp. Fl4BN1]